MQFSAHPPLSARRSRPWLPALTLLAALSATALSGAVAAAPAAKSALAAISLERIHSEPPLAGRLPRAPELSPAGGWVTYLRASEQDSEVNELWGQALPDGQPQRLVSVSDLIGGQSVRLTEAEKMALERRRVQGRGITGYQWCGKDDRRLILPLSGDLYLVELTAAGPRSQRLTFDEKEPERDPVCDAAGRQIAYVKGGDLWVQSLDAGATTPAARRLSQSGSETRSTGLAEFISAEEFGRQRGFWWSPDGQRILALEVDESEVPLKTRSQIFADRMAMTSQRYPGAGERNATVRALVLDVTAQAPAQVLSLPPEAEYIPRAGWFADGTPWLQWFTRDQKQLSLVEFSGPQAQARTVLVERDPAWVEVQDDLRELPTQLRSGKPALLWTSEASGRAQFWLVDRVSGERQQLSQQAEPVARLICQREQGLVFSGATERGRGREIFELNWQGQARMLQPGEARRWRDARADQGCRNLLLTESRWGQPPRTEVLALDGQQASLPLKGDAPDPLLAAITPAVQALDILAADGKTPLNAFYLPPLKSGAKPGQRHPVIVKAYGGPGIATVGWRWSGDTALLAYLQRQGFGVLMLDTRGMAYRDRAFTRAHAEGFGKAELADLFTAVRQLSKLVPSVDPARIGFTGWSYGGYLAARAMLDADTPFAAAIAGAPPTDWMLYDTAYTERYLGLPEAGRAKPYAEANLISRANLLQKPLMLVHGTADDNVLFENSLRLIDALQSEGKLFETVIYPGRAHGITGKKARLHLDRTQTDFFVRHLKP